MARWITFSSSRMLPGQAGLQDFSDFLLRWNFLPAAVDVRSWIDAGPFEAALAQLPAHRID